MRLLFDQNISFRITKKLQSFYPECKHVSDCGLNNSEDPNIWKYAKSNGFTIVTFDSDYYEMSLINGHPPKIIWLKTGNLTTIDIAELMINRYDSIKQFVENNSSESSACYKLDF